MPQRSWFSRSLDRTGFRCDRAGLLVGLVLGLGLLVVGAAQGQIIIPPGDNTPLVSPSPSPEDAPNGQQALPEDAQDGQQQPAVPKDIADAPSTPPTAPPKAAPATPTVKDIIIRGAYRVDPETILSLLRFNIGSPLSSGDQVGETERLIADGLKRIFRAGYFADVDIVINDDNEVIITVVENPIIRKVAFEGNKKIEDTILESETSVRGGQILSRRRIQRDIEKILTIYQRRGRFLAMVTPQIIEHENRRVDLVYQIVEGDSTRIDKIFFLGANSFRHSTLATVLLSRADAFWRFFSGSPAWDPDRISYDEQLLRTFYGTQGFHEAIIANQVTEIAPDRSRFFVSFLIEENTRYRLGDATIATEIPDLDIATLESHLAQEGGLGIDRGDWADLTLITQYADTIQLAANDLGFSFVRVDFTIDRTSDASTSDTAGGSANGSANIDANGSANIDANGSANGDATQADDKRIADAPSSETAPEGIAPEGIAPEGIAPEGIAPEGIAPEGIAPEGIANVRYTITRAPPQYIERVLISGNTVTLDRVIRRALLFNEGDAYNQSLVNQSINRIRQLGYFEDIQVQAHAGSVAGKLVIEIAVKEARTARINFAFGVSTVTGVVITGAFGENNFRGRGQAVDFQLSLAQEASSARLVFTEPSWRDSPLSYSYAANYSLSDYSSLTYSIATISFTFGVGTRINDHWRYSTNLEYAEITVSDLHDDASDSVRERAGTRHTVVSSHTFRFADFVGSSFPRRGLSWSNTLQYAGFGGNASYVRLRESLSHTYFFSDQLSLQSALTGVMVVPAGKALTVTERTLLGGNSFRGFTYGGLGPRDAEYGDALGGEYAAVLASTLIFPVGLPKDLGVRAIAFLDTGMVTGVRQSVIDDSQILDNGSVRIGGGFGVAWRTPFGPLQFLFPRALQKESYDSEQTFLLSVGG